MQDSTGQSIGTHDDQTAGHTTRTRQQGRDGDTLTRKRSLVNFGQQLGAAEIGMGGMPGLTRGRI